MAVELLRLDILKIASEDDQVRTQGIDAVDSPLQNFFPTVGIRSHMRIGELYNAQTGNNTKGLLASRRTLESVLPYVEIENDIVKKIELFPLSLASGDESWQVGLPKPGFGLGILERLREMSAPYGTGISIREDGIGEVKL